MQFIHIKKYDFQLNEIFALTSLLYFVCWNFIELWKKIQFAIKHKYREKAGNQSFLL